MAKDLISALQDCQTIIKNNPISIYNGDFIKPAYLVCMAAYLYKHKTPTHFFNVDDSRMNYLITIGFFNNVWGINDTWDRPNLGKSYSLLTMLDCEESVDSATTQIGSCINAMVDGENRAAISPLIDAIGEVHDNVWSHGKSTGFSMAQKYNKWIEFALADCGSGFLKELNRVGIQIDNHEDAIEWCIKKGNSSKTIKPKDDWAQQLPPDVIGNPMGSLAKYSSGNNHAGLGLPRFIDVVESFGGELTIITGNAELSISNFQNRIKHIRPCPQDLFWDGVIIQCRLQTSNLNQITTPSANAEIADILDTLIG
ncbi:hypothetical protein A7P96_05250 [Eikenella sp. NML03-A-027]|uniref:hypothetical protein n=1 Tax=Eikenella sp. NML03-A-027 TaxID=1795828 RepID=UPI0007DF0D69|nr:hypothetical protein [Eikenella sp. NML03-A-027]OAM31443.1 hypothetical protein A7P96_05250 [Eikenella sp. NML03-A-027]